MNKKKGRNMKNPFDLSSLLDSLNEDEYKERLKKELLKLDNKSIELFREDRHLFQRIHRDFIVKNGFTKMDYGILKLKMHMYHEEKKEFRQKYQRIDKFLLSWDHPKDQFHIMEMYIRKIGRNIKKMKDFHEWVVDIMDTKKIEQTMKSLKIKEPPIISNVKVSKEFEKNDDFPQSGKSRSFWSVENRPKKDDMYISPASSIDFTREE